MKEQIEAILERIESGDYEASPNGRALMQNDFRELLDTVAYVNEKLDKVNALLEEAAAQCN